MLLNCIETLPHSSFYLNRERKAKMTMKTSKVVMMREMMMKTLKMTRMMKMMKTLKRTKMMMKTIVMRSQSRNQQANVRLMVMMMKS
jgi:hypothetical protein